jgi:glycine cleavage system aminomethyltransferase T
MGWERPLVFGAGDTAYTWAKPGWLDASVAEQRACRTAVAVFDQTSFSKYAVRGPGALAGLQWVCAADVDVEIGRCVYTPLLNARGTYEADLTVTRTGVDSFLMVSSSATTVRDLDWLHRQLVGRDVEIRDVTDGFAVLGVMGPRSRDLLAGLTDDDLTEDGFPFATSRELMLAGAGVRATRMTYVGELGWELMVPVASAVAVYDALRIAGADMGLVDAGYHAIE